MQMNDENIQTEEVKRAAEPEYKIPEDAADNSRPNETAEVVTREYFRHSSAFLFLLFYPLLHVPDTNIPLLNSSVAVDHFVSFPSLPTSKGCLNVSVPVIEPSSKLTFRNL